MQKPKRLRTTHPGKQGGVALIEAAIALVLVTSGLLAYLGLNAKIAGISAQNRASAFTLLASQAAQEMLRNQDFATIPAAGSGTINYRAGTLGGSAVTSVTYCWTAVAVVVPAVTSTNLLRLTTTAVATGACDTTDLNNPARIQTLLARSNPKASARNSANGSAADGEGELVTNYTPPPNATTAPAPGGFNYVYDANGTLLAVTSPSNSQVALVPKTGSNSPLKIATINGNVVLDHSVTATQFNSYKFFIEGNALCNKFHPNLPDAPPSLTANGQTISVFQYSCVVADGWRRSIALAPADTQKKVCVGWPDIQTESAQDELASVGRQYFGNKFANPPSDLSPVRSGMRGSTTPSQSQIGTICTSSDACWAQTPLRPWVPGGHHYFVIDTNTSTAKCADRMDAVFVKIDFSNGETTGTRVSNYGGIFFRNTHRVYCANTKDYTDAIYDTIDDTPTQECISSTKMSGFILPGEGVNIPLASMELTSNSNFESPCAISGPFGTSGGTYFCSYKDLPDSGQVDVSARNAGLFFSPNKHGPLNPLDFMHDITGRTFTATNASGACAAATLSWAAGGNQCTGSAVAGTLNATQSVQNTAPGYTGSASYLCGDTGWTVTGTPTCTATAAQPSTCAAGALTWTVGGNSCTGSIATGSTGNTQTLQSTTQGLTGSASYSCGANGSWTLNAGATCSAAAQVCTTATVEGSKPNNSNVSATSGFSCTAPSNSSYRCTASNVPSGTSVTVTRTGPGNQSGSITTTITSGACSVTKNLP